MGKEKTQEALRLKHELYLSEYRIFLTATLTVMFGLVIGVTTDNIKAVILDKTFTIYAIIYSAVGLIYIIRRYYHKELDQIRTRIEEGK